MRTRRPTSRDIEELLEFLPLLTADGFTPITGWGGGQEREDGAVTFPWPVYDEAKLVTDSVDLPVQVNGKLRGTIQLPRGADENTAREAALADEGVQRHVADGEIAKVVYIPDRLLNLVVRS